MYANGLPGTARSRQSGLAGRRHVCDDAGPASILRGKELQLNDKNDPMTDRVCLLSRGSNGTYQMPHYCQFEGPAPATFETATYPS